MFFRYRESALYRIEIDFLSHVGFWTFPLPDSRDVVSCEASNKLLADTDRRGRDGFPEFKNVDFN